MSVKRRCTRHRLRCKVEYTRNGETFRGTSGDLSRSGLFLKTDRPSRKGDILRLIVHLPDGSCSKLTARVIRSFRAPHGKTLPSAGKNGMGLDIMEKDERYESFLRSFAE